MQQNQRVGAFAIFGCLKIKENVGKKKQGESSRTIAPVTDKLDDKTYSLNLKLHKMSWQKPKLKKKRRT